MVRVEHPRAPQVSAGLEGLRARPHLRQPKRQAIQSKGRRFIDQQITVLTQVLASASSSWRDHPFQSAWAEGNGFLVRHLDCAAY
jgi:hypothetical protein